MKLQPDRLFLNCPLIGGKISQEWLQMQIEETWSFFNGLSSVPSITKVYASHRTLRNNTEGAKDVYRGPVQRLSPDLPHIILSRQSLLVLDLLCTCHGSHSISAKPSLVGAKLRLQLLPRSSCRGPSLSELFGLACSWTWSFSVGSVSCSVFLTPSTP